LKPIETSGQFLLGGMDRQAGPNSWPDVRFEVWPPVLQVDRGEEVAPEFAVVSQVLCCTRGASASLTHDDRGVAPGIVLFDDKSLDCPK